MIGLPASTKVWLAAGSTDMRFGFNGLAAKVADGAEPPRSTKLNLLNKKIPFPVARCYSDSKFYG